MANQEASTPIYSIGVVKKRTELTGRQIRYYEECDLVKPARTEGNQRIYSENDIKRLTEIKKLLDEGLNIAGIKKKIGTAGEMANQEESTKSSAYDGRLLNKFDRGGRKGLTSLYPVSNRAQLYEVLDKKNKNN
ncbi:putative transcriptional regulator [Halobacteroides halobius DSM 5150]|uniref:Putative transcriptional regulator n=1 Tax=Halobacteroides halobius (strain ATCC 35273 / DSM 5150 / MD-1) TaxID=748449 RepID=L0K6F1_HALHC|nr:MerR family transcriptional regulator [Halobacteroides halobius]AGB40115.1 putative transcriptional regulator [Halobacteroides halobius DSM 5150]